MNTLRDYVTAFFDDLEIFEDVSRGHHYKVFIKQAVLEFLDNESKETAFAVFTAFFDSYRIHIKDKENSFIDLLDVLRSYEENAATLIEKQRDHYIHSVNVFLLGLCIYIQNKNYRTAFNQTVLDKNVYPFSYDTKHEEFFYRWGLAALFHDVGYPVEIISKQLSSFFNLATEIDNEAHINPHVEFDHFETFNSIIEIVPKKQFIQSYYERYDSCVYIDLLNPTDLLAHKIHLSLGVDLPSIKNTLNNFVNTMANNGFVDHGFYSAIIVLKWYGYLIQSNGYKPDYFYYPILDSASAILLHNMYRNVLQKAPYNQGILSARSHPIGFLLIFCDELQEWNREAYGRIDKKRNQITEASIFISDNHFEVTFLIKKGVFPAQFAAEKEEFFNKLLDLQSIFSDGFTIDCQILEYLTALSNTYHHNNELIPRPLLENLEKIAIAIHERYNRKQKEIHPDQPLAYPRFSDLPDSLKYSNLRQARSIFRMLEVMGWEMKPIHSVGEEIVELSEDEVETLAELEHEEWVNERKETGWKYGEIKDVESKISPYMVTYEMLDEEIKELDRDPVRNIPELLSMIGMRIYKK